MICQRLLHYEVVQKLGEGGMGVVWKARDVHLDRFVALKVLPAEKLKDPKRRRRFVQETEASHGGFLTPATANNDAPGELPVTAGLRIACSRAPLFVND